MGRAWVLGMVAVGLVGFLASPAPAQEVLYGRFGSFVFTPVGGGLVDLGLDVTLELSPDDFLDQLRLGGWDMVVVRSTGQFPPVFADEILGLLEAHVAAGGALHFEMADLQNAPRPLLDLLGLEGAVDLELPLSDIIVPTPPHPIWDTDIGGRFPPADERFGSDYGDHLILGPSAFSVSSFGIDGPPAMAVARGGRVVVNGQEWDNWWPGARSVARRQLAWIISCKADLDGDGDLTVFDFIEFQNLFDAGDARADVFYDGRLDVFDFLAFFNQFEAGC